MAIDQVVEDHRLVAGALQGANRVAADVAFPTGDENCHWFSPGHSRK